MLLGVPFGIGWETSPAEGSGRARTRISCSDVGKVKGWGARRARGRYMLGVLDVGVSEGVKKRKSVAFCNTFRLFI